jgi:hypothetical protein
MVQQAVIHAYESLEAQGGAPRLAFIREGPYAVPRRI